MALTVTLYFLSAFAGLAIGSFLNVVIYRLPKGNFFSKARSFCPKCGAQIKAYDNIPILSYIILRGKCRNCKAHISLRYPIIEALNCVLWIVNFAVFKISYMTLVYDVLVSVLIVIAMIDFDTFEIPDSSNITILLLGLITFIPISGVSWQSKLIGCVCISVPMLIIALFGGMGLGDVKLYFVLGLLFGWQKILVIFLISVIAGGLFSVIYMIVRKKKEGAVSDESNTEAEENREEMNSDGKSAETDLIEGKTEIGGTVRNDVVESAEAADGLNDESKSDMPLAKEEKSESYSENTVASDAKIAGEDADEDDDIPKGKAIPFGPFIVIASIITVYFGDMIINAYMKLLGF